MAGSLFGKASRANATPIATTLRVQSSIQGRPIALGYGQNRIAGNMVWYGGFQATSASSSGGKGGAVSSVFGKGSGTYNYWADGIISICEGPNAVIQTIYNGNNIDFLVTPSPAILADLTTLGIIPTYGNTTYGGTYFQGSFPQAVWSFLTANFPSQAIPYPGQALACFSKLALGTSPSFPNFNFEMLYGINSDIPALGPDANPADI